MLKDKDFNVDYVYTGLISPTKTPSNSYWLPRNISVNFISFQKKKAKKYFSTIIR